MSEGVGTVIRFLNLQLRPREHSPIMRSQVPRCSHLSTCGGLFCAVDKNGTLNPPSTLVNPHL